MSAFFNWDTVNWDTDLVAKAIREKLAKMDQSLDPNDYADGIDEWIGCTIDVPELVGKEDFTDAWDVNIECDYEEGFFRVTAYPIYEAPEGRGLYTETSCWITLVNIEVTTIKMNVNDLEGDALDWAVTKAEGYDWAVWNDGNEWGSHGWATSWEMSGPIIEREGIGLERDDQGIWFASFDLAADCALGATGQTPLIAAMRFHVDRLDTYEIEVPSSLIEPWHEKDCPAIDGLGCRCGEIRGAD